MDEEKIPKYVQWQEAQEKQTEIVQGKLFELPVVECLWPGCLWIRMTIGRSEDVIGFIEGFSGTNRVDLRHCDRQNSFNRQIDSDFISRYNEIANSGGDYVGYMKVYQ